MRWRDRIRRTVDRSKWRSWRFFGEALGVLTNYSPLRASRDEDAKGDPRLAHLTLKQYAVWVRASVDAMGGRLEAMQLGKESGTLEDTCKDIKIAQQRAWERLYERWPELKGKV